MRKTNWKKAIALLMVFALVLLYIPIYSAETEKTETTIVYHETFEDGLGKATVSGNATLTPVTDKVFTGNDDGAALYVSHRTNNWDGVDFVFTDIGLEDGKTYTVTVNGFVDAGENVNGGQVRLQTADKDYGWLEGKAFISGEAFTLSGQCTVGANDDTRIRCQSDDAGAEVPFYIGDILITYEAGESPDEEDEEPETEIEIYHETFIGDKGVAVQSGGATLTPVAGKIFEGNEDGGALYVSNRANDYDAVDYPFSDIGMVHGKTYDITVTGYVYEDVTVPDGAQAYLQTIPVEADAEYGWLGSADFEAGKPFKISAEYTVDTSEDRIRIQSNDHGKTVPFYIGDVIITENGVVVFHETFPGSTGDAVQSGNAKLTAITSKTFDGNKDGASLYISNRANDYDAADFMFDKIGLENGETYNITVTGYVYEDVTVSDGAQVFLQTIPVEADADYGWLGSADFKAGQAFIISAEYTVDTSKDRIRIQSNNEGKTVPFLIGDILITQKGSSGDEEPLPPAEPFTLVTFEDGEKGGFVGRAGTETLTVTEDANHTEGGKYALKVEGRTDTWHGPSVNVRKYIDKGSEYKVSAWVKMDEPENAQLMLSTQIGQDTYINIQSASVNADKWVLLQGTYRYNSSEDITIYVESSNANASFYIDDINLENTGAAPIDIDRSLTPIKEKYEDDFLIGNAISAEDLEGVRFELLKMHHNVATAGNAMKPDALQPEKGKFTFEGADHLVNTVLEAGMKMHGHTLAWHSQSPAWMNMTTDAEGTTEYLSREEALENLRTHIQTVVEHFGDRVIAWDVVNEAMNDNPPNPTDWKASLRQSPWYHAIGDDYIEQAFLAAREVLDENGWDVKLYYNDYNDDNQNKATAIYHMVKEINEKYQVNHPGKLLIDGVGMQAHYSVSTNPANVELSLERFIELGVEVSVTELDIMAGDNYQLTDKLANAQGYLYAQLFKIYKKHADHIARVTFWGLDDGTSWRSSQNPLLFDKDLQAKRAYHAVMDPDKFMEEHEPDISEANRSTANYGTPIIDGEVDSIWSGTQEMQINRYQMAWQGASGTAKALWDDSNLYILFQVSDTQLDKTNAELHEQDSIEVFIDENNEKTSFYQDDDGQYRVNYENEASFNPAGIEEGFESKVKVSGTNYTVELKIPFRKVTPQKDMQIGFDAQINDAKDGSRQSVAAWNDYTGNGYQDTSVFGIITLVDEAEEPEEPEEPEKPGSGSGSSSSPSPVRPPVDETGKITTTIRLDTRTGSVSTTTDSKTLAKAFEKVQADENGKKTAEVVIPEIKSAKAYELTMPTEVLSADTKDTQLKVKTGIAEIILPGEMLYTNVASDDETATDGDITLSVAKADIAHISEETRSQIGDRPVVSLQLKKAGEIFAWNNPDAPVTVSIPYTPTEEELTDPEHIAVWYIDGNGNIIEVPSGRYNIETGMVTFTTSHFSSFAVVYVTKTFNDLDRVDWAKNAIEVLASKGVVKGITEEEYAPNDNINRADFLYYLIRTLGVDAKMDGNFEDIRENAYYYKEIAVAKQLGITLGCGNNLFKPDEAITRQDMMVLTERALRMLGRLEVQGTLQDLEKFADKGLVADYAINGVAAVVLEGLIVGDGENINPRGNTSRAEAAMFLYRIYNQ